MVTKFPPSLLVFATVHVTGMIAPVEAVAEQLKELPEVMTVTPTLELLLGSTQVTALIAVACSMVKPCVAVRVFCTCEVAVMVTTLLVGTVAGAVYNPALLMEPFPVPLTDQFTRVLVRFTTVAVHCAVPSTVTSVGTQDTVIVGATAVEVEPQELRIAAATTAPASNSRPFQRTSSRPSRKFRSNTRNPPGPLVQTCLWKV